MKNVLVPSLVIFLLFSLSIRTVFAFEEEHEAHEHGHATLMLVQENNELQILFKSPAMNITGFEHQANSSEDKAKVEWAKQSLSDAPRLFQLRPNAKCKLEHLSIESSLLDTEHHSDAHDHHEEHHGEGEHAKDDEDSHSEFEAEYHFECDNMSELKTLSVGLFEIFNSLEEVEVQIINDAGQKLQELAPGNTSIKL